MSRPDKFTKKIATDRRKKQKHKVENFSIPKKAALDMLDDYELKQECLPEFENALKAAHLFYNASGHWRYEFFVVGNLPYRAQPVIERIQPTPGEMRATIGGALALVSKLEKYCAELPAKVLSELPILWCGKETVVLSEVIDALRETLTEYRDFQTSKGKAASVLPKGSLAKITAAGALLAFLKMVRPDSDDELRQSFLQDCFVHLGIKYSDPVERPKDWKKFFTDAKAMSDCLKYKQK